MTRTRRYKTNILFPKPSVLDGFGSVINVAGNYFEFKYSETGEAADRKAIENDWGIIGDDIREIIKQRKCHSLQHQE